MARTGWFKESARHSLSARGIPTGRSYFSKKKYFAVNDPLKGNREDYRFKRAYAKGWTKDQLRRDPDARAVFGISVEELGRKRLSPFPEAPDEYGGVSTTSTPQVEELPFEQTVEEEQAPGVGEAAEFSGPEVAAPAPFISEETEPDISSAGVPSEPSEPTTSAPFKRKEPFWWKT